MRVAFSFLEQGVRLRLASPVVDLCLVWQGFASPAVEVSGQGLVASGQAAVFVYLFFSERAVTYLLLISGNDCRICAIRNLLYLKVSFFVVNNIEKLN